MSALEQMHVAKSGEVHRCCCCAAVLPVGTSLHKEKGWSGSRLIVRYYDAICWMKRVREFGWEFCEWCDDESAGREQQ